MQSPTEETPRRYLRENVRKVGCSRTRTISYTGYDPIRLICSPCSYQRYFYMRMRNVVRIHGEVHSCLTRSSYCSPNFAGGFFLLPRRVVRLSEDLIGRRKFMKFTIDGEIYVLQKNKELSRLGWIVH